MFHVGMSRIQALAGRAVETLEDLLGANSAWCPVWQDHSSGLFRAWCFASALHETHGLATSATLKCSAATVAHPHAGVVP
jgi:hypothetical protein